MLNKLDFCINISNNSEDIQNATYYQALDDSMWMLDEELCAKI